MKVALDLHGCITDHPKFFSELSKLFISAGHEIHILTGSHLIEKKIEEQLLSYNISWTKLFSIADHHKETGTKMWYDKNGNPWVDKLDWDQTKAKYCKREGIDLCFDDTDSYAEHFETPFALIKFKK